MSWQHKLSPSVRQHLARAIQQPALSRDNKARYLLVVVPDSALPELYEFPALEPVIEVMKEVAQGGVPAHAYPVYGIPLRLAGNAPHQYLEDLSGHLWPLFAQPTQVMLRDDFLLGEEPAALTGSSGYLDPGVSLYGDKPAAEPAVEDEEDEEHQRGAYDEDDWDAEEPNEE